MFAQVMPFLRKICVIGILTLYVMLCEVSHVCGDPSLFNMKLYQIPHDFFYSLSSRPGGGTT